MHKKFNNQLLHVKIKCFLRKKRLIATLDYCLRSCMRLNYGNRIDLGKRLTAYNKNVIPWPDLSHLKQRIPNNSYCLGGWPSSRLFSQCWLWVGNMILGCWSVGCPVGKECICPREVGSPLLRALLPTYLRTYCPSSPFLLMYLIELKSSNETFYGEG